MTLLVLTDVHKNFASRTILDGASLQIDPGEKLGLVGPNGSGKTTLLRLIAGEDELDTGELSLRRGARIATVPQRPEFPAGETVKQHAEGGLSELRAAMAAHHEACEALGRLHEGPSPDAAGGICCSSPRTTTGSTGCAPSLGAARGRPSRPGAMSCAKPWRLAQATSRSTS